MENVTFLIEGAEVIPRFMMPVSASIYELKQKIKEITGVKVARQTLVYENMLLTDSCTIRSYNFGPIAGIFLAVTLDPDEAYVNVTVSSPAFKISVKTSHTETVLKLKQRIGAIWGIQTKDITLWHLARKMKDELPLFRYYIHEGSNVLFTRTGHCT